MKKFKLYKTKSFIETGDIQIKPITIFVGRNSSGKSSLIRFPVVLCQTFNADIYSPLLLFGNLIDYGNFDDIVYKNETDIIRFDLSFDITKLKRFISSPAFMWRSNNITKRIKQLKKDLSIGVSIRKINKKILVDDYKLFIDDKEFVSMKLSNDIKDFTVSISYMLTDDGEIEKITDTIKFKLPVYFEKFIPILTQFYEPRVLKDLIKNNSYFGDNNFIKQNLEKLLESIEYLNIREEPNYINIIEESGLNTPNIDINKYKNLLKKIYEVLETFEIIDVCNRGISRYLNSYYSNLTYIGPFRKEPERIYRDSEHSYNNVGKNGENVSMLLRQADQNQSDLLNKVSKWLHKSMGYKLKIEEIENSNLFKLKIHNKSNIEGSNIIDVGYGIAQVLPIVTQLYLTEKDKSAQKKYPINRRENVTIIEQPELHLHPAAQAELADLFVEKIQRKGSNIIVETHSEHLIRKLQVLVANPEYNFTTDDINIYYVDKCEEGYSTLKKMEINENGQFKEKWPTGFFDKSYTLSRELLKYPGKKG